MSADTVRASTVEPGPFTCPVCRAVSFNPDDAIHGFCSACKAVTGVPFNGPGTKVLVVGDTHRSGVWLRDTVIPFALATGCATIMQVGDFGFVWDTDPDGVREELDWVHQILDRAGLTLTFLPGNHENHAMLYRLAEAADRTDDGHHLLRPTIRYTGRVAAWEWDGLRVAAVGGAVSIDREARVPGISWWPEETLTPHEVIAATRLGPVDILFSHDAPNGVPMRLVPDAASAMNRLTMTRIGTALAPDFWFHGHYHEALSYLFRHPAGVTKVRGLHCHLAPTAPDAMVAVNLGSIRRGLDATRPRPPAGEVARQCPIPIHDLGGGAPGRCGYPEGHNGRCEP